MTIDRNDQIPATRYRLRRLASYEVLVDDFDRIEVEASRVGNDFQFAIFWIPLGIMSTITLLTVPMTNGRIFNGFFLFMLVSYGFGIHHGMRAWKQRGSLKGLMAKIRAQQDGPIGEEGKELRPSELAALPLQSAPAPSPSPPPTSEEPVQQPSVEGGPK